MPIQQKIKLPSPHCDCKVVNHTKITKHFFPKENLICPDYIFPFYTLSLFIHCILLSREILVVTKITPQNTKSASQFFKKKHVVGSKPHNTRHIYCEVNFKQ